MFSRHAFSCFALVLALAFASSWTGTARSADAPGEITWRIRFLDAAIVRGPVVTLGEVAVPAGNMPEEQWAAMADRELWPSPSENGKPMSMTRPRLQEAVARTMKDLAPYCLFPSYMQVQRGGAFMGKEDIQRLVENALTPYLAGLPGESQLSDFRLPHYIFVSSSGQAIELAPPRRVTPGRLSLRLLVKEVDGTTKQRLTGSVFVNCWIDVPVVTDVMNRGDSLDLGKVTFKRLNLANLRDQVWDGKGGPWRVLRPLSVENVIYQSDLGHTFAVRKGDKLSLVYEGKAVSLTMPVEALQDGNTGESITVRNLQSRKDLFATVLNGSTVVIKKVE